MEKLTTAALESLADVFRGFDEVAAVYLFGSHAEGRASRDSDLDLAVVSSPGSNARRRQLDLLTELACHGFDHVDLAFLDQRNPVVEHEVVRHNRIVFSRPGFDPGALYSRVTRAYLDFLPLLRVQHQALKERILRGAA